MTSALWGCILTSICILALGACGGKDATIDSGFGPGHAKVSLVSGTESLIPGRETILGVHFDLEPGWHLYWNGRNDTGYAPRITLDLPEGFEAGALQWPVPKRLISPGSILDHVYEREVTLLIPLRVPADAVSGRTYTLRGEASWLACHDVCVPGKSPMELEIQVEDTEGQAVPSGAQAIATAKASLPGPDPGERAKRTWENETLVISAPGASRMTFFPDTASVEIAGLLQTGEVTGDVMRLTPRNAGGKGQISGILGIEIPPDTLYFSVRDPLPYP